MCRIGLHQWGRAVFTDHGYGSHVLDYRQKCDRCGKMKTWVKPKKY
ncbi:MAG: hypothetical protein WC506_03170 [Candidatus Micrarchaeia archaeon]